MAPRLTDQFRVDFDPGWGFQARNYFICANTEESMQEWKRLISLTAMLCWRCGRQCFPSDYQGNDPNGRFFPTIGRLYHPECMRCEPCRCEQVGRAKHSHEPHLVSLWSCSSTRRTTRSPRTQQTVQKDCVYSFVGLRAVFSFHRVDSVGRSAGCDLS